MSEFFKGNCPQCQDEEIYSHALTNGLCLNCFYQNEEESRLVEIECKHDYEEGLI